MRLINPLLVIVLVLFLISAGVPKAEAGSAKVEFYPNPVAQGKSFLVKVYPGHALKSVSGTIFGKSVRLYHLTDRFSGIIGVPVDATAGVNKLKLVLEQEDGSIDELERNVVVNKTKFDRVQFWLKPTKKKLLSPQIVDDEWARVETELLKESPKRLWSGDFRVPSIGRVSMRFGAWEIINRSPSGRHRGVDYAGRSNYRVRAANTGKVVFADYLEAFGNTIAIDHGQGINSLYFHLSSIKVKQGDTVSKGQPIGFMGSTGVATGVHLHWGMSVHNLRVDPLQWVYGSIWK